MPSLVVAQARGAMFKLHMGSTPCQVSEEEWRDLGIKAEGYSGSDISIVVRDAMMQPVRKVSNPKKSA